MPLQVHQPAGGFSRFKVFTRNLSAGGLSFLHMGFLHIGSTCTMALPRLEGRPQVIEGVVRSCRVVEGGIHEVGLEFERVINLHDYVSPSAEQDELADEPPKPQPKPQEPAQAFVKAALRAENYLRAALEMPNLRGAIAACQEIKQHAWGLGLEQLHHTAAAAIEMLETTGSVAQSASQLQKICTLCAQIRAALEKAENGESPSVKPAG